MVKKVRLKTRAELAAPEFRSQTARRSQILGQCHAVCEKLSKSRKQFLLNVARGGWNDDPYLDGDEFARTVRHWISRRKDFFNSDPKMLEVHFFTCNYDAHRGFDPLIKMVKPFNCDAGTAMRLFWINDPVFYSKYPTISSCPNGEERDAMRLLRVIKTRFRNKDFRTTKIPFDPRPWIAADDVDLQTLRVPEALCQPIAT